MDKRQAHLVDASGTEMIVDTLPSGVEDFRPRGGSGTRMKGGPQDVVQDSRYTELEKHQMRAYFEVLSDKMRPYDQVVIFGPAQAASDFNRYLKDRATDISSKVVAVEKADSMTMNQVTAWVRDFFN